MTTYLTGEPDADALLDADPNALLIGMVLDQQVPMEKAFGGPAVIAERMDGRFDVAAIAATDEDVFVALCSAKPAIHRFPASMGKRIRRTCRVLVDDYDGHAENIWSGAATGTEIRTALMALPGFGPEKAAIFTALLGKQRGVTPSGWREAAGPYGEQGVFRSVADIVDEDSLRRVRETKKAVKAAKKAATRSA
ncbi:MAG: Fe-S cluster assembly protein HesB [Microlunatus sp.]|nr:Fe-S cluster assembly protein HesB [Microlunatus sp.]MDN5769982.1 Fe-S cluster assembly protein HesB [Microlunatus sp.]